MLAVVLVACCLGLLVLERGARQGAYARVGSGAPRQAAKVQLGCKALPCLALPAIAAILSLGVPFLTIGGVAGRGRRRGISDGRDLSALWQTMLLALAGGLLTVAAALPIAWLAVRGQGPPAAAARG